MPLATKNGSLIVKDGQLAEGCGCCGGWYCYGCDGMVASVRARVVSFPDIVSDLADSGSASAYYESSVSELAARTRVADAYNALRGTYRLRSQPSGGWVSLSPVSSAACDRCEYGATIPETSPLPISSQWKVIVDACDVTSCISVIGFQIPTRLSVEYVVPQIQPSDSRIKSRENTPGFGALQYSAYLDDSTFASGGSCSYSNNSPIRVHQNASGGSALSSAVDYAYAGVGNVAAVRLVQQYQPGTVLTYRTNAQTNGGTQNGSPQSTYRDWLSAVNGVTCTTLKSLQQSAIIEVEVTTR